MQNFSEWLGENANAPNKIVGQVMEMPIGQLLMTKEEIVAAVDNLSRGLPSMTEGPVEVDYHESIKRYQLTNGYHRLVETLMSGRSDITVKVDSIASWRPPSGNELFVPDWNEEYHGMEEFIEVYILRRL